MSIWINYHHLFYFKTIAEEGSVSKAANKLRLGQPTLSAQLKQFEENLGVSLFERTHKKLTLTEHGKVALDYSKSIFNMGEEMYEALHDRLKPTKPSLHIGALDSVPKNVVLFLVQQAYKISPCQITLSEGKGDELLRQLTSHHIDIMITNYLPTGTDAKSIYPKSISKKNVALFGSKKFSHLKKGFPKSISGHPLIVPTYDSKLRQDIDHWAHLHEIELNIVAETQDYSVKDLMAKNEMGLVPMASHSNLDSNLTQDELHLIGTLKGVYEELYLLTAQRKIQNPIASRLNEKFSL